MNLDSGLIKNGEEPATYRPLKLSRLAGLQARMTFSYMGVTIGSVLIFGCSLLLVIFGVSNSFLSDVFYSNRVNQDARSYASMASSLTNKTGLNLATTFHEGQRTSLIDPHETPHAPYISGLYPVAENLPFALVITPQGRILASSYPRRYPTHDLVTHLLPNQASAIHNALQGTSNGTNGVADTSAGKVVWDVETIWNQQHVPVGALYLQEQRPTLENNINELLAIFWSLVRIGFILLLITAPIGSLFGLVTTRGLVRRVRHLVTATTHFADGDYAQRVRVTRKDEIGQLEQQFNRMAQQLRESMSRQRELAAQNARMSERARITRELHDAISQDLFSLHMLAGGLQTAIPANASFYPQILTLKQTTTTVIREMRALLLELRPTQLEHLGLTEALEDLATAYRNRLGIEVTTSLASITLAPQIEHTLLRITQEALSNAARHADATTIDLILRQDSKAVILTVSDNGKGFSLENTEFIHTHKTLLASAVPNQQKYDEHHGLGLKLMRERVSELQGTFTLQSILDQGTQIVIVLPLELENDSHCDC